MTIVPQRIASLEGRSADQSCFGWGCRTPEAVHHCCPEPFLGDSFHNDDLNPKCIEVS
jgi:hypothetical protein